MKFKHTIKYVLLLISFQALNSNTAFSTETHYGIGATLSGYNSALYLPINTTNYIFEPSLGFNLLEEKQVDGNYRKIESIFINFGLYKKSRLTENSILYYGPSIGYQDDMYRRTSTNSSEYFDSRKGFNIGAMLGVEYFQSRNFSIGINLGVTLSLRKVSDSNSAETSETQAISTAKVIFRYHFK